MPSQHTASAWHAAGTQERVAETPQGASEGVTPFPPEQLLFPQLGKSVLLLSAWGGSRLFSSRGFASREMGQNG